LVWRAIPHSTPLEWHGFGESLFLLFKIGVKVVSIDSSPSPKAMIERFTPCWSMVHRGILRSVCRRNFKVHCYLFSLEVHEYLSANE